MLAITGLQFHDFGTNEEKYSTRGRARLLFEMMRGDVLTDGFADAAVEEALDLCLACKGCKHDCPVEIDMATYKAEFRARHYARKRRPRAAYSMGQIARWARFASHAPQVANLLDERAGPLESRQAHRRHCGRTPNAALHQ